MFCYLVVLWLLDSFVDVKDVWALAKVLQYLFESLYLL